MNIQKQLEEKKNELQQEVTQYNQAQQALNSISQNILKKQGAIEALEEIEKEDKKEK